jgi:ABC-type bacteriocin/lantibiotic exporter with double-glycine peptidase domain
LSRLIAYRIAPKRSLDLVPAPAKRAWMDASSRGHAYRRDQGKLLATTIGGLQTMETINATGGGTDFFARWAGYHARVLNGQQQLGATTSWLTAAPTLLNGLSTAAILTLGGLRVMEGSLTAGTPVAFQSLMSSFLTPVNQMMNLGSTLQRGRIVEQGSYRELMQRRGLFAALARQQIA